MKARICVTGSVCLSPVRANSRLGFARHRKLSARPLNTWNATTAHHCHSTLNAPSLLFKSSSPTPPLSWSFLSVSTPIFSTKDRKLASQASNPQTRAHDTPASELNHDVTTEEEKKYDEELKVSKEKQRLRPWTREGSDKPPVSRMRQASAMTKGKLLTTPTRLFKIILPLTTRDYNVDRKTIEPLALLVHPSQPLSYLERLIQAELPMIKSEDKERDKIPDVNFRAEDAMKDEDGRATSGSTSSEAEAKSLEENEGRENESHTHLRTLNPESARDLRGGEGEGGVESYNPKAFEGAEREPDPTTFVRWSKSTEIGDFIRDASRGREFAVEIEGQDEQILVGVPTFGERTYYLRIRLRKKAHEIGKMAELKKDCDIAAHHYSQRVAYAGFGAMLGWGGVVAWLTFETKLGWDVMEPVTYLVGLAGLLGGYGWFLAHNREASYRSAMNLTVSRKQQQLYEQKGFDLEKYNYLVEDGNKLRKEIRAIAGEYDVDWDEKRDAQDESVIEALKEGRDKKKKTKSEDDDDGDDD